jgi:hypothetical protein
LEDYDFLLRVTAKYAASFRLVDYEVGDYYLKKDGSNTSCLSWNDSAERRSSWDLAAEAIAERRRTTAVSAAVQKTLGWRTPLSNMTIEKASKRVR